MLLWPQCLSKNGSVTVKEKVQRSPSSVASLGEIPVYMFFGYEDNPPPPPKNKHLFEQMDIIRRELY